MFRSLKVGNWFTCSILKFIAYITACTLSRVDVPCFTEVINLCADSVLVEIISAATGSTEGGLGVKLGAERILIESPSNA